MNTHHAMWSRSDAFLLQFTVGYEVVTQLSLLLFHVFTDVDV